MNHPIDKHKSIQLLSGNTDKEPATERRQRLLELAYAMDAPHVFRKGQLVRWKAGLKNCKLPAYNEAAIVRAVLTVPVFDTCEQANCSGSPYFGIPLTLVLAVLDPEEGDFLEFHVDGWRFEPAES
jgi:hypothetical protein